MSKLKVTEVFYSIQGEGKWVGAPSIFLRTFGCNFTCGGFAMPKGEISKEHLSVDPSQYKSLEDMPLVKTGCDSYIAWDPRFKHLSPAVTVDEVVGRMKDLLPGGDWAQANGNDIHLVITGGEPLLGWQKVYPEIFSNVGMSNLLNVTFETNGTQKLHNELTDTYGQKVQDRIKFTFSVSPKLSVSGEKWSDAIKPEIVRSYEEMGETYLKFVVTGEEDIEEVDRAVAAYRAVGFTGNVYIMPVGGVVSAYDKNKFNVANAALKHGYYYSPRLHTDLFGNGWLK